MKKEKIKRIIKGFLLISGILFWLVVLSLLLMGWVGLIGVYWVVFGMPLALMVVFISALIFVIVQSYYIIKSEKLKK